jgi:hypothetical protein
VFQQYDTKSCDQLSKILTHTAFGLEYYSGSTSCEVDPMYRVQAMAQKEERATGAGYYSYLNRDLPLYGARSLDEMLLNEDQLYSETRYAHIESYEGYNKKTC